MLTGKLAVDGSALSGEIGSAEERSGEIGFED